MPLQLDATEVASMSLAVFVFLAATFLGIRQCRDARERLANLSARESRYFRNQDLRRAIGTVVLLILSVALVVGGRMPIQIAGKANLKFVQIWSGVAFLLVALFILAVIDLVSTRVYAGLARQRLANEGLSIIEDELRIRNELADSDANSLRDHSSPHHLRPLSTPDLRV